MTRHGTSHALATLACTLAGGLLVRVLADHLPAARAGLDQVSTAVVGVFQLPWSPGVVSQFILAAVLAFVWGVAFELSNRRRRRRASLGDG
jgi:hypothetical protein